VKRINVKFLLILIAVVVVGGASLFFLRRWQVSRNAGSYAKLAKERLAEGKTAEAMNLYSRYVGLRPDDHEAYAEFARLMLGRAEAPDATRNDLARAYQTLETAVRRSPNDDDLRRTLAEFQLKVGRSIDAKEHLDVLRQRLESGELKDNTRPTLGSEDEKDKRPPIDANLIDLLTARSLLASNEYEQAAEVVATMVDFDLASRMFTDSTAREKPAPTEAYLLLAAVLDDKLSDQAAATRVLERLVTVQPNDIQAWLARSSWHRQRGDLEAADADIKKAVEINPDDINAVFAAFEVALARRDLDAAQALAEKGRAIDAYDERVYRGLASIALQRNDPATAEEVLLDGVSRLPGKAGLLLMLADTLLQQNKLDEVEQALGRIKDLYGESSPAVGLLEGRLLVARGKWADAKMKLEVVRPQVSSSPDLVRQVDLYLGQCHAQLDEYDAQLDVNQRILTTDPTSLAARVGAAAAMAAAGKSEEALEQYERIAAAIPPDRLPSVPQVWYPLLQLRIQQQLQRPLSDRDWSVADSLLEMLAESPDVTPVQLSLLRAELLSRKEEFDAAREVLEKAADLDPSPHVWSALVSLALRSGDAAGATAVVARIPAEVAGSAPVLTTRAQLAAQQGEAGKAELAAIETLAGKLPEKKEAANVLSTLAGLSIAAGDAASAERIYREVARLMPQDIRAREAILELVINRGDVEESKKAAADVAEVAGGSSARSRVAEAAIKIFEVRQSQAKRQKEAGDDVSLTAEEKRSLDEARNLLIEAENDRPRWGQIQSLFAEVDSIRGDASAAASRLKKAVELGPANPATIRRLVALLYTLNRLDEAQEAIALLGAAGTVGTDRIAAEKELQAGNVDKAVELAEASITADSTKADDLLWLGQIMGRAGKPDRAGTALERAAELAPDRTDVWLALFSHQVSMGMKTQAERSLDKATDLMTAPQKQLARSQGLEMLGRLEDAETAIREAVAISDGSLDSYHALAAFLVRRGKIAPANEAIATILDSTDTSKAAKAEKAWARRLKAELIAERGNYREMEQAMDLLEKNVDEKGQMPIDDVLLQVKLLTSRPEPSSWKRAIKVMDSLAKRQPLNMGQRIILAQLHEKVGEWTTCRDELVAVTATPSVPPAYVAMLVEKLIDHGETTTARQWLNRLEKLPNAANQAILVALEAKLAIADNDRKLAAEAARKLMPGDLVSGSDPSQLAAVAKLMEELNFPKAADKVLLQCAEMSPDGVLARAEFLGRQQRPQEGLDLLESRWDSLSLERLMGTAVQIVRVQDDPIEWSARIEPWFAKAKRLDPGSIVLELLDAERLALENRAGDAEKLYRMLLAKSDLEPSQRAIVSNNLAFHLAKASSVAEATTLIEAAIAELGPLPDLLDTRGLIRLAAGDKAGAVADFTESVLQPSDVKFLHLASAQLETGDRAGALESLEAGRRRGLKMSRLSPDDRKRLATVETALGVQTETSPEPQG